MKPEPLPQFDGEGGSCTTEEFIEEARTKLTNYSLSDGAATEFVLGALTGCAKAEILSRPANTRSSAGAILDLIRAEFGDHRDLVTLLADFHGRRQGVAEGVYQCAHAVLAAARVNAKRTDTLSEDLIRDRFADGLHPPELRRDVRRYIRGKPGTTFQEAKAEALRWMREDSAPTETLQLQLSAMSAEIVQLRLTVAALSARLEKPQEPAETIPDTSACNWCDQAGHSESDCPAKREYRQRRRRRRRRRRSHGGSHQVRDKQDSPPSMTQQPVYNQQQYHMPDHQPPVAATCAQPMTSPSGLAARTAVKLPRASAGQLGRSLVICYC
nr:hypothetical protein BaRGS_010316 [Batillaria attramentaria]